MPAQNCPKNSNRKGKDEEEDIILYELYFLCCVQFVIFLVSTTYAAAYMCTNQITQHNFFCHKLSRKKTLSKMRIMYFSNAERTMYWSCTY